MSKAKELITQVSEMVNSDLRIAVDALTRISDHEKLLKKYLKSRSDRRHMGMVDASELQDVIRIARTALNKIGEVE